MNERKSGGNSNELHDLDGGINFKNELLRDAASQGFNIEVFAFPEEKGRMGKIVSGNKPRAGLVEWRNEFAHGRAHRTATMIGDYVYSEPIMMAPAFRDMFNVSYEFSSELARFREIELDRSPPQNPLDV